MGSAEKRHLYYDQKKQTEEPEVAEHSSVTLAVFARRPPTPEDIYFFEQERDLLRYRESRRKEKQREKQAARKPVEEVGSFENGFSSASMWIYRPLSWRVDLGWRP